MCILSQTFNVYTIIYYCPYVALELDVGDYIFTFIDILYSVIMDILFSDFRFSDITAVMHPMPSIGLEENSIHILHISFINLLAMDLWCCSTSNPNSLDKSALSSNKETIMIV